MTSSEVQTYLNTIDSQGIPLIIIRLNAMSEFKTGTSPGITKAKQIITEANNRGIQVAVDLHTWYTTWDTYFRDSATNHDSYRSQYINYVKKVLSAFSDSNAYAFMVLNEPQARKATTGENQFILDIISAANTVTSKPISVRFMGGYSPSSGYYSTQIDKACDLLCRNVYWDPRNPSASVYGTTQAKITAAITAAHSQNKQLWITEFGKNKANLEEQRSYVKAFVSWAKTNGVDAAFCWVSQPESGSGESYNIFNGYKPNPAFYELKQ
jgi:aryl-phospho-beta-D-glucosidase BglC (GH1 family)